MNVALLVTVAGPVLGVCGWLFQSTVLFWVGVAVCALTLVMNLLSGVMRLPVLPAACMAIAAALLSPWYLGLAVGLVTWTTVEAFGEMVGLRK